MSIREGVRRRSMRAHHRSLAVSLGLTIATTCAVAHFLGDTAAAGVDD